MKTKILLSIIMVINIGFKSHSQNTWTQKANFGGEARESAIGFSINNKGYIGIGSSGWPYTYYKDFWEYDPTSNTWAQKADFAGESRIQAVGFSIGNKGYIGTGYSLYDTGFSVFKDFWEYNPATNTWTQKADFAGTARYGAAGFSIGKKGYIGTGYNLLDEYTKDFWEYDPLTNKWIQKTDFGGEARGWAVGFNIGNKGYLGTGISFQTWNIFNDLWEYTPDADTWTRKADIWDVYWGEDKRGEAVGFAIGNKGYIGTGTTYVGFELYISNFFEYDPSTDTWTPKANFGGGRRSRAAGFSIGNKGYIGTGTDGDEFNDFWEYTPDNIIPIAPIITSFYPGSGAISSTVIINGANFSANPIDDIVYFGAVRAVVAEATATRLKVYAPVGTTYEPITVTVNGLTAYEAKPFVVTFEGGGVIDENSFAPAVDLQMGSNPDQMAVADIDGDSRTDLIVGSYGTTTEPQNSVNIFRNTSTPLKVTFAPKVQLLKGSRQTYPVVADFDGDGKIDLAVMDSRLETLTLFINKSTPGHISLVQQAVYATGDFPYSIAKGDMDGDGKTDIVIPNLNGKNFSVYRNTSTLGSITFDSKIDFTLPLHPLSIAIGDLDKDKKADLVIGYNEYNNYVVSVFKNTSTSGAVSFDAAIDLPNVADGYTSGISIGDLDSDGKPDLSVSNFSNSASTISLFRNTGSLGVISFAPKISFSTKGEGFQNNAITDFDGDGKPDITGGNYWSGNTAVFKNTSSPGKLSLAEAVIYPAGSGTKASTGADIDGDGKPDIVFLNLFSGTISILRNFIADNGCTPPTELNVTNITSSSARLIWKLPDAQATSFEIRYRAVGDLGWLYRKADGIQKGITLHGLISNTTYQWEIRSNCGGEITQGIRGPRFTTASLFASSSGNVSDALVSRIEAIHIIPNPVKSLSTVIFSTARPGNYTLQLTDVSGKVLLIKRGTTTIGENRVIINMSAFAQGTYFISLTDSENAKRSLKLIKE